MNRRRNESQVTRVLHNHTDMLHHIKNRPGLHDIILTYSDIFSHVTSLYIKLDCTSYSLPSTHSQPLAPNQSLPATLSQPLTPSHSLSATHTQSLAPITTHSHALTPSHSFPATHSQPLTPKDFFSAIHSQPPTPSH